MATDTYTGVDDDEELKKQYPPVQIPGMGVIQSPSSPSNVPAMSPPDVSPSPYPAVMGGGPNPQVAPPPPPAWKDYAPPQPHGLAAVGHALASFSRPANAYVNERPEQQAEQRYGAATKEYEEQLKGGQEARKEASEEELKAAQAKAYGERGLTQEEIQRLKNEGTANVANIRGKTAEDVAATNVGGREETAKIMVGGKALGTKTIEVNGKPHVMMWNPGTHTYDRDLGEAPPPASATSAYANTRTTTLIDPESGLPTVFQYNPQTQTYDKPVGTSATGAYGHEMAQAGAVNRAGTDIITQLQSPDNREILGNLGSYIKQGTLGTPLADQKAAYLSSQLKTFAALQPAMHGFRARSAQEAFEKVVGGLAQDPDATIASIQGILKTAGAINPKSAGAFKVPTDAPEAPKEDGKVLRKDGNIIAVSKGGKWQAPPATQ